MAEQTLEIRVQTLEGEGFQKFQKNQILQKDQKGQKDQKHQKFQKTRSPTACNGQAREKAIIISRYTCARAHTLQEFCVFCCHKCHTNTITHYVITIYIDFRNNIPHCHTFTLLFHPKNTLKHHPQNNFSTSNPKQPVTFHKTTRCFQQNHTSLSIK